MLLTCALSYPIVVNGKQEMASADLFRLVYISRAVELFSSDDLNSLLERARAYNQSRSVTGLLLYKDLSFLQVLEGHKSELEALFASISADSRHFRIKLLVDMEAIPERSFPEWSMGFQRLGDQHDLPPVGFSDFLDAQWELQLAGEDNAKQQLNALLSHFRSCS